MVSGWLEAAQHWLFRTNPDILTIFKVSADVFWVNPLVNLALFLPLAMAGIAVARISRRDVPARLAVLLCAGLGVYGLATLTNKMHKAGAGVLALGIGLVFIRALGRPAMAIFVRRTAPIFLVLMLASALGINAGAYVSERSRAGKLPAAAAGAPNVLLVIMDTVRADHLSLHGYPRETSPNIDRWARGATVFDNGFSTTSWTLPAHASMLTGRPAYEHGADRGARLDGRFAMLSEFLRDRGYATGAFTANDIWLSGAYGFHRGFLRLRAMSPWSDAARTSWGRKIYSLLSNRFRLHHLPVRKSAARVNAEFTNWMDDYSGRPFFAMLNYFDVHDPYWPPPGYDKFRGQPVPNRTPERTANSDNINAYDGLLAYVDTQFGALLGELERRGALANTIVILTSDHGESLGDHKQRQHGDSLYRELLHVPLVIAGPGIPAGQRLNPAVSVQQIPATVIAALCGGHAGDAPAAGESACGSREFPGRAMTDYWEAASLAEEPVLAELKRIGGAVHSKSLITAEWQYVWNASGPEELYNTRKDPRQLTNLAAQPDVHEVLSSFRSKLHALFPSLAIAAE